MCTSNFVDTIKQFYSQGYRKVYDGVNPLAIPARKWSFHIHGLGIPPAHLLDENSLDNPYEYTLRFAFDLELIWHTSQPRNSRYSTEFSDYEIGGFMESDDSQISPTGIEWEEDYLRYQIPDEVEVKPPYLGLKGKVSDIPDSVRESYKFYKQNVSQQDWGMVYGLRITIEGEDTLIIRTIPDGRGGWVEVFDNQGNYLASAITEGKSIIWEPLNQIRGDVLEKNRQ